MAISKQTIVMVLLLIIALAAIGAGYQFWVKETLERYNEDERYAEQLERKLENLQTTFARTKPELVLEQWRNVIDPWEQSITQRKQYFTLGDATQIEEVPEDKLARYHYEEQYNELLPALQQEVYEKGVYYQITGFGVPAPPSLSGSTIREEDVERWLRRIALGCDTVRMLVNANARFIQAVELWPPRTEQGVLRMHTAGLAFSMNLADLVAFVDQLTTDRSQFYDINAIWIANRNLVASAEPLLEVQMLVTRAEVIEGAKPQVGGARSTTSSPFGGFSMFSSSSSSSSTSSGGGTSSSTSSSSASGSSSRTSSRSSDPWWKFW